MFKLELKYKKFKLEQEEGGSMFDEQWQFAVEVEREYAQYRKKVMMRYHLSAAEVDILLFLANMHIPQELRIRSRGTERHSASN